MKYQLVTYSKSILLLAIGFLLAAPLQAQPVQLDFPSVSPGIPAYARIHIIPDLDTGNLGNVPRDEQWVALVFYRDPDCIPVSFDLGEFFDFPGPDGPGAFGCQLLIEGMELWANGPDSDMAPMFTRARNAVPDLPIWFFDRAEFDAELENGSVFINDLTALPSLIRARAFWFEEYLNPPGGADDPGLGLRANGRLESGGRFYLEWQFHPSRGEDEALFYMELQDEPPPVPDHPRPLICVIRPDLC
jgi:hypothetical protein